MKASKDGPKINLTVLQGERKGATEAPERDDATAPEGAEPEREEVGPSASESDSVEGSSSKEQRGKAQERKKDKAESEEERRQRYREVLRQRAERTRAERALRQEARESGKQRTSTMPIPLVGAGSGNRAAGSAGRGRTNRANAGAEPDGDAGASDDPRHLRVAPSPERIKPGQAPEPPLELEPTPVQRAKQGIGLVAGFFKSLLVLVLIVGPMVVAGYYYFFVAADRYEVRTVFLIRTAGADTSQVATILGQTQAFGRAADESFSVVDYLLSYEGLVRLQGLVDLRAAYSKPEGDPFYYLPADSSLLDLYDYFQRMIDATYDQVTGLVTIDVQAFTPEDSLAISKAILKESERLINEFNKRAQADLLQLAREEVSNALGNLETAEGALTEFRKKSNVIDPSEVIIRVNGIIAGLEGEVSKSQAELLQLSKVTGNKGGVARLELEARIDALKQQVERERERLVGEQESMGNLIPEFELLTLRKQLAGQAYSAALTSMQAAVAQAQRQQLYVVPVVAPTELDEAQLPDRWENLFFVFLVVMLIFTIGRLLILGIRDHIL